MEKGLDPDYAVMIVCFVVFTVLSVRNYHPIYDTTVRQRSCAQVLKLKEWRMSEITCLSTTFFRSPRMSDKYKFVKLVKNVKWCLWKWHLDIVKCTVDYWFMAFVLLWISFWYTYSKHFSCCVKRYQDICLRHVPRSSRILSLFNQNYFATDINFIQGCLNKFDGLLKQCKSS